MEARMNKFQEGLQQQRKLVEQLRLEAAVPRVRVSECIEDIMKYCEQHISEDVLITGFVKPGDNPYKEKGGCTILWTWTIVFAFIVLSSSVLFHNVRDYV